MCQNITRNNNIDIDLMTMPSRRQSEISTYQEFFI